MPSEQPYCEKIRNTTYYYSTSTYQLISIPICFIGAIFNLLNILVFTRKTMNSPSNRILAHLAFADFLVLLSYIPNNLLWNVDLYSDFCLADSYGWTMFFWYNDIFTSTFQFVSVFLTVQLAVWRYTAVVHPWKQRNWCNEKITRNVIITGYIVCCLLYAIPFHLSFDIETIDNNQNTNTHPHYNFTIDGHPIMYKIRYYIYGLVIRLFPSVILVWLTFKIVVGLSARKRNHEQLTASAGAPSSVKNLEMRNQTNKSTVILLAVVVLFFTAEFPRGILWILGRLDEHTWETVYDSISQVFVTIDHINIAITFVVYYSLSQPFRTAFRSLFNCDTRTISHETHTQLALGNTEEINSERRIFEVKRFSTTDNHLRYSTFLTVSQTNLGSKTPTETRKISDQNSAPSPRSSEC